MSNKRSGFVASLCCSLAQTGRRYETTSQAYDQRVSQLRIAKRRIKRMMESKRRREENEFDVDSGSDEDSKFLRLHQQHITLQAEIEALSQFREVTDRGPDHELDPMRATVAKLQQQVEAARERLEAAQQTLQMYKAKNEVTNKHGQVMLTAPHAHLTTHMHSHT